MKIWLLIFDIYVLAFACIFQFAHKGMDPDDGGGDGGGGSNWVLA